MREFATSSGIGVCSIKWARSRDARAHFKIYGGLQMRNFPFEKFDMPKAIVNMYAFRVLMEAGTCQT